VRLFSVFLVMSRSGLRRSQEKNKMAFALWDRRTPVRLFSVFFGNEPQWAAALPGKKTVALRPPFEKQIERL